MNRIAFSAVERCASSSGAGNSMRHFTDLLLYRNVQAYLRSRRERRESTAEGAAAWSRFYARFDPLIKRRAQEGIWRSDITPDDRAQHVWSVLIATLPDHEFAPTRASLDGWIDFLTRRELCNLARSSPAEPAGNGDGHAEKSVEGGSGLVMLLERNEIGEHVHRFLEECEAVGINVALLRARWFEERTLIEIARERGKSEESVRIEHYRILKRLRIRISHPAWRSLRDAMERPGAQRRGGGRPTYPTGKNLVTVLRESAYLTTGGHGNLGWGLLVKALFEGRMTFTSGLIGKAQTQTAA